MIISSDANLHVKVYTGNIIVGKIKV